MLPSASQLNLPMTPSQFFVFLSEAMAALGSVPLFFLYVSASK